MNLKKILQDLDEVVASHVAKIKVPNSVDATYAAHFKLALSRLQNRLTIWHGSAGFLSRKHAAVTQLLDKSMVLQQNELVTRLTVSTVDDSGTVRVITAITLIYLPMTALGVCLTNPELTSESATNRNQTVMAMPLFTTNDVTGHLKVSSDVWKYFVVAVPLTVLTLILWRVEVHRMRKQRDKTAYKLAGMVV